MLKKLIIIEDDKEIQCDTLQDLEKMLIDKNYNNLTDKQKKEKLEMKAIANTLNYKIEIVSKIENDEEIDGKFVIKDEITFILSILLINKVILLERTDSNILTGSLDKTKMTNNYIIVNKFVKDLLSEYLKTSKIGE